MSDTFNNIFDVKIKERLNHVFQEEGFKARPYTIGGSVKAGTVRFPIMGKSTVYENRSPHTTIQFANPDLSYAEATPVNWETAEPIDSLDGEKTNVNNMINEIAKSLSYSVGRRVDYTILKTIAQKSGINTSGSGTHAAMSKTLMATVGRIADEQDWMETEQSRVLFITPKVAEKMNTVSDFVTIDSVNSKPLHSGHMGFLYGFSIVKSNELEQLHRDNILGDGTSGTGTAYTGTDYDCLAWDRRSVGFETVKDLNVVTERRADINATQALVEMSAATAVIHAQGVTKVEIDVT